MKTKKYTMGCGEKLHSVLLLNCNYCLTKRVENYGRLQLRFVTFDCLFIDEAGVGVRSCYSSIPTVKAKG